MGSILVLKVLRPESQLGAIVLREYDPRVNRVNRVFLNERTHEYYYLFQMFPIYDVIKRYLKPLPPFPISLLLIKF